MSKLLLSGPVGTMLAPFSKGLGVCDFLNIEAPEKVLAMHRAYIEAGADIITTNTFNSNRAALATHSSAISPYHLNAKAASIAREAIEMAAPARHIFVSGLIGAPTPNAKDVEGAFREQAEALIESGADIIQIETLYDSNEAAAALRGIRKAIEETPGDVKLFASATATPDSHLPSGESLHRFVEIAEENGADLIGLNCGFGPENMRAPLRQLIRLTSAGLLYYPAASAPGRFSYSPEEFAMQMSEAIGEPRVAVAGGCCGATEAHIRRLREHIDNSISRE